MRPTLRRLSTSLALLLASGAGASAADTPGSAPGSAPGNASADAHGLAAPAPRKPERARWAWNRAAAEVTPQGGLRWQPEPFAFAAGPVVRYIDFEHGSDDADGSRAAPWRHHPWDPAAGGKAKAASGPATYVFKRGVVYRGELRPGEGASQAAARALVIPPSPSRDDLHRRHEMEQRWPDLGGTAADPVRLTSDPAWGTGEAVIAGSEIVTGWINGADRSDIPTSDAIAVRAAERLAADKNADLAPALAGYRQAIAALPAYEPPAGAARPPVAAKDGLGALGVLRATYLRAALAATADGRALLAECAQLPVAPAAKPPPAADPKPAGSKQGGPKQGKPKQADPKQAEPQSTEDPLALVAAALRLLDERPSARTEIAKAFAASLDPLAAAADRRGQALALGRTLQRAFPDSTKVQTAVAARLTELAKGHEADPVPPVPGVWYADVGFAPRSVWAFTGEQSERIELARTPNWSETDPEDPLSGWWRFQQPEWWANGFSYREASNSYRSYNLGLDELNIVGDAGWFADAVIRTEYGLPQRGTPYPTTVRRVTTEGVKSPRTLGFDGPWYGDSGRITSNCRYFLEDRPQFLDAPGEFWYDAQKQRLYLRLSGDRDPNTVRIEAAKRCNLIESRGISHLAISGLTFRSTNVPWDLTAAPWADPGIDNAAIRVRGTAEDVRIDHCRFRDVGKAVRIDAAASEPEQRGDQPLDRVVIADNEIERTDHGALTIASHGVGDVRVLRNRMQRIGLRPFRQDDADALVVRYPATVEIAGNVIERCAAAGISLHGGKPLGDAGDAPLARSLVHHNLVADSLLMTKDCGGIDLHDGGPFFCYANVSRNPHGTWWDYDPAKPGTARLGYAFRHDGASKTYDFCEIALGGSVDWRGRNGCATAFYESGSPILNQLFNNTIARFWIASQWSSAGSRRVVLGNVIDDIGGQVFQRRRLKEDHDDPLGEVSAPGEGAPAGEVPAEIYGRNVFSRIPSTGFAVGDGPEPASDTPAAFAAVLAARPGTAGDVGMLAPEPGVRDAAGGDLRPKSGSAVLGRGVRAFVPWALARTVGEWHFRRDTGALMQVADEHWYLSAACVSRTDRRRMPRFDLRGEGFAAADQVAGPLEDWTAGALRFDGRQQHLRLAHESMATCTYGTDHQQVRTLERQEIASPDVGVDSFLIEAVCRTTQGGRALVAHAGPAAPVAGGAAATVASGAAREAVATRGESGYQLRIDQRGAVVLVVLAGGKRAELASTARITDGAWHHVLAQCDRAAGTGTIFIDGVACGAGPLTLPRDASLANDGDLLVGKSAVGEFFAGELDFLRIARSTLAESQTSIEELYDWQFDGPFLRDFAGRAASGTGRDARALEADE